MYYTALIRLGLGTSGIRAILCHTRTNPSNQLIELRYRAQHVDPSWSVPLERSLSIEEWIVGMRSTELRSFAIPNCSYFIIGSMCFKVDWVAVNLRRLRDAAVLTIISVPRPISFSSMICTGTALDTSCLGCFRRFLDNWPPQRTCHVTQTSRNECISLSYGPHNQGWCRGRQENIYSRMLLVLCLGCDLSLVDRSELSLVFVDSGKSASLFVRDQTAPR